MHDHLVVTVVKFHSALVVDHYSPDEVVALQDDIVLLRCGAVLVYFDIGMSTLELEQVPDSRWFLLKQTNIGQCGVFLFLIGYFVCLPVDSLIMRLQLIVLEKDLWQPYHIT